MLKKIKLIIFIIIINLLSIAFAVDEDLAKIPQLVSPVMDTAHVLSEDQRVSLNNSLFEYAKKNGSQIVILSVDDIYSEPIADYAARVMENWKIGRKNIDDGVLILIVKNTHNIHIAVGRGLEGAIPDIYARRIISQIMVPAFKLNDYDKGIENAVNQIEKLIAGEGLPKNSSDNENEDKIGSLIGLLFFLIFVTSFLNLVFGKKVGSIISGGIAFGLSYYLGIALLLALGMGVFYALFSFFFNRTIITSLGNNNDNWPSGGDGFSGGGGGFSGGGGSFGGGGASGKW